MPQKKEEEKEEEKVLGVLHSSCWSCKLQFRLQVDDTTFDNLMFGKVRRRMWTFLERPGSSMQAKAFELSSTLFVAISVMGLSFGTIPDFQVRVFA